MNNSTEVTESNFHLEVLKSPIPVLVDFWAEWCAPCKMVEPVLNEIAQEYAGKLKVCRLNVDSNPSITAQYGIMSIPSLLLFKEGKLVDLIVGAVPKHHLVSRLKTVLSE